MKCGSWTRGLLLAVLLGFGMLLSLGQDSVLATEMATASDGAHHGPNDGGGDGDHRHADADACLPVCGSAAQGLLPEELFTLPSACRIAFLIPDLLVRGQIPNPDPGPPKIVTLG